MFDARYVAFATLAALLVISPGATLAVVVETALGHGRKAALLTVARRRARQRHPGSGDRVRIVGAH